MKKSVWGILLIAGASVMYGSIPTVTKQLLNAGAGSITLQMLTNTASLIAVSAILLIRKTPLTVTPRQGASLLFLGAVPLQATFLLLSFAYLSIPAGIATMLHFIYPVLTMLAMALFFRERLTGRKLLAMAAAVVGVALIANPAASGTASPIGVALALLSGVAYCTFVIANSRSAYAEKDVFVVMFWVFAFSVAGYALYHLATGELVLGQSLEKAYLFPAVGLMSVTALALFTAGVRRLGATDSAIVNLLEPVVSVVLSALVYNDRLTAGLLAGCAMILLSVLIVTGLSRKKDPSLNECV